MTRARIALALLLFGLAPFGCASTETVAAGERTLAKALVSDEDEARIGAQLHEELLKDDTKLLSDPDVTAYLLEIVRPIFQLARRDRPGVSWKLYVIDDPKTVNAFSAPGGGLYVYSGLLAAAHDDSEVAGVLGHEVGHEVLHHVAQKLVAAAGLEAIAEVALGRNPPALEKIAAALLGKGALLAFSRDEERQADEYGARVSARAGFNPYGLASFLQRLEAHEGEMPATLAFLSDHPLTPDRIADITRLIEKERLPNTNAAPRGERLREIQSHLPGRMPQARNAGAIRAR
jgi:predicted Zn-dependent protease